MKKEKKQNSYLARIKSLFGNPVSSRGGWFNIIREANSGDWQRNKETNLEDMLAYHAVYSCVTLIASDIAKINVEVLKRHKESEIWIKDENTPYQKILTKPNKYQTTIQFFESWLLSLLSHGNTYVLISRDSKGNPVRLNVLDPSRVQPCVSDSGEVFYTLFTDNLSGISVDQVQAPAYEIIHDRMNPLYHPLVGIPPLYAASMVVGQGLSIQENSSNFFSNSSRPGGVLTAPGAISDESVEQLKQQWTANYTGNNSGKVAVLADGLSYQAFDMLSASDSQVIEQLKWTAEVVCSVYHVPPYMIGIGTPTYGNNIQALNQQYYSQALQKPIASIQLLLKEGLGLPDNLRFSFNLDDLLKMDSKSFMETETNWMKAGVKSPNEVRGKLNLLPVAGGESPYMQQQNFSIEALSRRDAQENPFAKNSNENSAVKENNEEVEAADDDVSKFSSQLILKAYERFGNDKYSKIS